MPPRNPGLTAAAQAALPYWRQIEYAAEARMTTADLWSLIRDQAEEYGLATPGVTIQGVNQLRSIATGIQSQSRAFTSLPDSRALPGRYWTQAPWARTTAEQRALPKLQVRFQHTFIRQGELTSEWRTSVIEGRAPRTAGALRSIVDGDAVQLANKYNVEHVDTGNYQLLIV